ncbi:MAG: response regulator [Ignavibacteria bacterium]|nr:response regulator [Ignavibacteria bacterium]
MRISFRIILINFTIVAIILGGAGTAFYSIMFNVLTSQQSKYLVNSANSLAYSYEYYKQEIDDEAVLFINNEDLNFIGNKNLEKYRNLDFLIMSVEDTILNLQNASLSTKVISSKKNISITDFKKVNPPMIISSYVNKSGTKFYFGKILTQEVLTQLAKRINADVAVIKDENIFDYSNGNTNQVFFINIQKANNFLRGKESFVIYSEETENSYFLATTYKISDIITPNLPLRVIVFTNISEVAKLYSALRDFLFLLGIAGIALSLILTLLFTSKIRKQIYSLNESTRITTKGNFQSRLKIESKDEIGELALAFNVMLDELEKNEKAKTEYADFITLINQNPTLKEITENALRKIVGATGVTAGALYSVIDSEIHYINSIGINPETIPALSNSDFLKSTVERRETKEIVFTDNAPIIETGLLKLELHHLFIIPIIYNFKVIALLELASVSKPALEAALYIEKIKEQLAIGLTNSMALLQLENLVSELKVLNEEYQSQNKKVKKQNQRLVELHNEITEKAKELEIQKRKAEESTELKSQFLATMSHELRTPMNAILGLTELVIEDGSLSPKNSERLSVVLRSGKRLLNLINDILDLSKIEAGKMEIRYEEFLLEDLISEIVASMQPIAIEKKLDFRIVKKSTTNIYLTTDKGKILQILINLIGNALKFTESGFVELQINIEDEKFLIFEVADSGIGISPKEIEIIFHEFRQADSSPTRKYGGTGLGLSICKKFAELLNGRIIVTSKINEGSIFALRVPIITAQSSKLVDVKVNEIESHQSNNIENPILIVDDDVKIRNLLTQFVNSNGYETVAAETGQRGVHLANRIKPFVIILDTMIQDLNVWKVLNDLKNNQSTKNISVVLVSRLSNNRLGFGLGVLDYFIQPILLEDAAPLLNRIQRVNEKPVSEIFVIDDDVFLSENLTEIFSNYKVKINCSTGHQSITDEILEHRPDAIIVNISMIGTDPILLINELKTNHKTKHIPIIIEASNLSDESEKRLSKTIENIAITSNVHTNDILKIIRDSLKIQEKISNLSTTTMVEENKVVNVNALNIGQTSNVENGFIGEVLIVDDDPDSLFTINEIVQKCKCKTLLAKNGRECLEILETAKPDIILLDIMMPVLDGFQTIRMIRENQNFKNIPVLAVTAKAMLEEKEVIFKYGFDGYVTKPVNSGVLAFKITRILDQKNNLIND